MDVGPPLMFLMPTNRFDLALLAPKHQTSVREATQGWDGAEAEHDSPNTCQRWTVFLPQVTKAARELRVSLRLVHEGGWMMIEIARCLSVLRSIPTRAYVFTTMTRFRLTALQSSVLQLF